VYKGQWKHGQRHGYGTHTYTCPNSQVYKGQWKDGAKNGEGTLTFSDGTFFKGHWKDNARDGEGTKTYPNGTVFTLVYSKGRLLSKTESSDSSSQSSTDDVSVLGKRSREEIIEDNIKVARARNAIIDVSQ
jgi:hypothetical protein